MKKTISMFALVLIVMGFCIIYDGQNNYCFSNLTGFVGSCTEKEMPQSVCVDYYKGYKGSKAKEMCIKSNDTFKVQRCSDVNKSWNRINAKCKVTETVTNKSGAVSIITYFSHTYNKMSAKMHCDAYLSIPGFTSQWITE